jgi:hypothetical protein
MGAGIMNPITYLKLKREAKKRKQTAIVMLMHSGIIRSAERTVRYAMTPKEFKKMMQTEEAV